MPIWSRLLLIGIVIFSVFSFVWFLFGSTAYFQRGMDIIGTTYLWGAGVPVLLFAVVFTILLIKEWTPTSGVDYVGICVGMGLSILLSAALIQSVNTHGWANEKIRSDALKISADGKYEYRVDLINVFQRNGSARLYLKNVSTGEETYISTEIQVRKIKTLAIGEVNHWIKLEPTDNVSHYILITTKELGIPEEKFEIDIATRTSRKLE
ncbi:hypothetical protein QNH46_03505 [Paenibacillus woosongensis]|uniref:Uncharacterized protein n=1 Tax=Paenibacillus woosongensis TaxID=307580 RepID=A0AA95IBQ3_9BACL|nr:hypothetical protein [Paenibacillus woosongensis]WHX49760.1 hypothetical protein QNH46_03505 [Paenibacillus woosongensis]